MSPNDVNVPRVPIVFTLFSRPIYPENENAVYQLYGNVKPSMYSSPMKRTFIWI